MNKQFRSTLPYLVLGLIFSIGVPAAAEVKLNSIFGDHMVLQRDMPVPVWGFSDPGETITVAFSGQEKSAVADSAGKWKVTLEPLRGTTEPATMTVRAKGDGSIKTIVDVVVGEVWICAGQSNMQRGVDAARGLAELKPKVRNIRSFKVKKTVALTEQDFLVGEWVDSWPDSGVGASFAYYLKESVDVPVGIILTAWGSSSIEAWMPRDMTEKLPYFKTIMEEFDADTQRQTRINAVVSSKNEMSGKDDLFVRRQPNILYNAMMRPLAPYACRGLVWYQGERNSKVMTGMPDGPWETRVAGIREYDESLKLWIQRVREEWKKEDLHFLLVMLPGFGQMLNSGPKGDQESPETHSWAWMRESQMAALELPHTAVANTIDLGELKNIHPKDKMPVGRRLALLAERETLGRDVVAQGPVMKNLEAKDQSLIVHYDEAEGLKTLDGKAPTGFWLSDDSGKWFRAEAKIQGETVILQSSQLDKPLVIRYAFSAKPTVNLVNGAGLPAYPFRTDHFDP